MESMHNGPPLSHRKEQYRHSRQPSLDRDIPKELPVNRKLQFDSKIGSPVRKTKEIADIQSLKNI